MDTIYPGRYFVETRLYEINVPSFSLYSWTLEQQHPRPPPWRNSCIRTSHVYIYIPCEYIIIAIKIIFKTEDNVILGSFYLKSFKSDNFNSLILCGYPA